MPHDDVVPSEEEIYGWITEVFARGIRRPGYPADRWAEDWLAERLRAFGLEEIRREPVELPYWEPRRQLLQILDGATEPSEIACFPLPHSAPARGLEAPLAAFDPDHPDRVRGAVALVDLTLMRIPHAALATRATHVHDPGDTLAGGAQVLPFGREFMMAMEPAIAAGAVGFVGVLRDYPGDSKDYYVPYDAVARPIPGVWVRGSDGAHLRRTLASRPLRVRLQIDAVRKTITSHNIVGVLPGADDETVIVGTHHDGPWASAVEDGSGMALVLAQAAYWSRLPRRERPHRLVFLVNAGHMAGGAGTRAFIDTHRAELGRVVLELHLEHTAAEFEERDGRLAPTGHPEPRWWFTSRIPQLEAAVHSALKAEGVGRSFILPPDVFGPHPTTDGGFFHLEGVPLVNFLTAPFYLFDAMDTMDKIHRPSLVPVTRAAVRIIEATAHVSAAGMRDA